MKISLGSPQAHQGAFTASGAKRVHLLLVASHPPFKDPRILWEVGGGANSDLFICIGLHSDPAAPRIVMHSPLPNVIEISVYRYAQKSARFDEENPLVHDPLTAPLLAQFHRIAHLSKEEVIREFSVREDRVGYFKDVCCYFAVSAERLADVGAGLSSFSSIIAADMDALLPALALKAHFNVPLIYDAHEIWPESGTFTPEEIAFWCDYEKIVAAPAEARFVASAPSAAYMSKLYGMAFAPLPNCEPAASAMKPAERTSRDVSHPCTFVFQGGLARTRGLHLLVGAWPHLKSNAVLVIRGPVMDEEYVKTVKAAAGNLLGKRVIFAPSVTEAELVSTAAQSDIGVIPYEPVNVNNSGCCPNKLSQYLAAGLPILSNDLPFVRHVIETGDCGVAVDFTDRDALVAAIDTLASNPARVAEMSRNATQHFLNEFNWEKQSAAFYEAIDRLVPAKRVAPLKKAVMFRYTETVPPPQEPVQTVTFRYAENIGMLQGVFEAVPLLPRARATFIRTRHVVWKSLPLPVRNYLRPLARRILAS